MSRLFGRSIDVYNTSKYLVDGKIPQYKKDKTKTDWESVETCPEKIELYLPDNAIKLIEETPIRIVNSPLVIKEASMLPRNKEEEPTLFFPRWNPIEEYKRELIFFLGTILSIYSPDELPKENDIACEYGDILGLLLEYLYLKEIGKTDEFSKKHLDELLYNAKNYIKSYQNYQKNVDSKMNAYFYKLSEEKAKKLDEYYDQLDKRFLKATLTNLVPMSSMDGVLQIADKITSKDEMKHLLEILIENKNHNRQEILNNMGIESYGYKRLIKEIDRGKKNE